MIIFPFLYDSIIVYSLISNCTLTLYFCYCANINQIFPLSKMVCNIHTLAYDGNVPFMEE